MFGFRSSSADPKQLLEDTESPEKEQRLNAVKEIGQLDKQYPEIKERLEYLKDNDNERKVRKEAQNALKKLKDKPIVDSLYEEASSGSEVEAEQYDDEDVPDAEEGGRSGTAFDDTIGDQSLGEGEMDVESDLSKDEEDRRERQAEGKGIQVNINEKNYVTVDYQGNIVETGKSIGKLEVANTGSKNRINGIDLYLNNVDVISADKTTEEHNHIGMIKAGNSWSRDYNYERELEIIEVKQDFVDPETDLTPNFLGGTEKEFENRITIINNLDTPISNVTGKRFLNEFASLVDTSGEGVEFSSNREEVSEKKSTEEDQEDEDDTSTRTAEVVNFSIETIEPGATVNIVITLKASLPSDVPTYTAGKLSLTYNVEDTLTSGLEFASVDGVSDIKQKIRKKQREEDPFTYDAEVTFENKSEFVYQIKEFEVREGDVHGKPVLEWQGKDATEDEREIVPGERVVFEFVYNDEIRDGNPSFGQHLEFQVQEYHSIASEYNVDLPGQDLKFMALEIRKAYLDENNEETTEFSIPSYVETEIPARIWVTGIGTYPLDNVEIVEEIPEGFEFCDEEDIKVYRNGSELARGNYEIIYGDPEGPSEESYDSATEIEDGEAGETVEEQSEPVTKSDLSGGTRMQINIYNLQDTDDGPLAEGEELSVDYCMVADQLEPRDESIKTYAFTEGYINDMPDNRVHDEISDEDGLKFSVIHLRDDIDIGKYVSAREHEGQDAYVIELGAQNYGTSTQTLTIKDIVPIGFEMVEGSMSSEPEIEVEGPETVEEGKIYTWTFDDVAPEADIMAKYKLVQIADDANPRLLQKVYQG